MISVIRLLSCCLVGFSIVSGNRSWVQNKTRTKLANPALYVRGGEVMSPPMLFANAVALGEKKANTAPSTIFKLATMSGAHIAFGGLLALLVGANMAQMKSTNPGLQKYLFGICGLPFGLFMVLVAGGELFTGNVAIVGAAFLEGKTTLRGLLKNWGISFLGNFIGSLIVCKLVLAAGLVTVPRIASDIAAAKIAKPFMTTLLRGVICNWMVCMAVWVSNGCSTLTEKYLAMVLPVSAFVAFGAEHSVANMALVPLGMASGAGVSWSSFLLKNLLPVTIGNIIGGFLCHAGSYKSIYGTKKSKSTLQ